MNRSNWEVSLAKVEKQLTKEEKSYYKTPDFDTGNYFEQKGKIIDQRAPEKKYCIM